MLIGVDPKTVRRERPQDHTEIRAEMREIAAQRRRFGYRDAWLIKTDFDWVVEKYQAHDYSSIEPYLPPKGVGLTAKLGVVPDSIEQAESFLSFKFVGQSMSEQSMPLSVFKELVDNISSFVRHTLLPTALNQGRNNRFFDVTIGQPRFASLLVSIKGFDFDSAGLRDFKPTKYLDPEALRRESLDLSDDLWKSISETSDMAKQGGLSLGSARSHRTFLDQIARAEQTIRDYRDHVERLLAKWLDTPLSALADNPAAVADMHDHISRANGRIIANNSMRTLRAIYNHSRKRHRDMPAYNPTDAVDWNPQERRNTAMGLPDLPAWFNQLRKLNNPIRREYHLFTLLSGSRPTALKEAKPEHLDVRRRVLHIPRPKGGAKRAFDIPLSREMMLCLIRAIRFGRVMYPTQASEWIFPSESGEGHLCEQKEARKRLAKWGNDLRQTYRTLAAAAGVSEIDARLLMNHVIQGVNAGYITRHKLLEGHLRFQQQAISTLIFSQLGEETAAYPARWWCYARGALIEQNI